MGMFQVRVTVASATRPERAFTEPFWVDTGALYSFAPEDRLRAAGIEPKFPRDFVMADGRRDRPLVGEALFRIEGIDETVTCLVVFGPVGSPFLLGFPECIQNIRHAQRTSTVVASATKVGEPPGK